MGATANPRRVTWQGRNAAPAAETADSADAGQSRYDVTIPEPVDERMLALRKQIAELSARDPQRFVAVVRESHRLELDGADPTDALEQAITGSARP